MSVDPHIAALLMVKDEEARIHVTLNSITNHIDSLVVYDTGSTDKTLEIIRAFCKKHHITLRLKEGVFTNFAESRNVALDFADSFAGIDFLLLMDANDELRKGNVLRDFAREHITDDKPAYYVHQYLEASSDSDEHVSFYNIRFIRRGSGLRYSGYTHETIYGCPLSKKIPEVQLYQDREQDMAKSRLRYQRDVELLTQQCNENPDDSRTLYYLGQSYHCLGNSGKAIRYYKKRIEIVGGFEEERFVASWMIGVISDNWDEKIIHLMKAYEMAHRAEPVYELAKMYSEKKEWAIASHFAELACEIQYPSDALFYVEDKVYHYERWRLLALITMYNNLSRNGGKNGGKNGNGDKEYLKRGLNAAEKAYKYSTAASDMEMLEKYRNRVYLNKVVDRIFVINLDERTDRWEEMEKQFQSLGIDNYERFSAIKYNDISDVPPEMYSTLHYTPYASDPNYQKSAVGCKMSHYNIVKISKEQGYERILILEDDVKIVDNFRSTLEPAASEVEWDMLYLGATFIRPNLPCSANTEIVTGAFCTHAYMVNNRNDVFDYILDNVPSYGGEIDVFYAYNIQQQIPGSPYSIGGLNHNFKAYISKPQIAFQKDSSESDILPKKVDVKTVAKESGVITVLPKGGFGNVLFTVMCGWGLAVKHDMKRLQFIKNYQDKRKKMCEYDMFRMFHQINSQEININDTIVVKQPPQDASYFPIILNKTKNYLLDGYFQSYKYSAGQLESIKKVLFANERYKVLQGIYKTLSMGKNTIMLHVRRGDYLQMPTIHPPLPNEYYIKSLKKIPHAKKSKILVFSDDNDYVTDWSVLKDYDNTVVNIDNIEDVFTLMTMCDDYIIANSSLSLLGYYFRNNKNAIMCMPSEWFGKDGPKHNLSDFVSENNGGVMYKI